MKTTRQRQRREDEMPVSALLARQATASDAAIAQALTASPATEP